MSKNAHNAIPSEIGTLYQFYFFIKRCLRLKNGEEVGFERFDDVDTSDSDRNSYYQLKHSLCKKEGGRLEYKNMAPKDADFWKTIHVWIDMIISSGIDLTKYISGSTFILVTNKCIKDNSLIKDIKCLKNGECDFSYVKRQIECLIDKSEEKLQRRREKSREGNEIKEGETLKWMREANDFPELGLLFMNMDFEEVSMPELKSDILHILEKEKYVNASEVETCFSEFLGEIVSDWSNAGLDVKNYLSYNSDSFCQRFHGIFEKHRVVKLNFNRNITSCKLDCKNLVFIRQLLDIDDIRLEDEDDILYYTLSMLNFQDSFQTLDKNHDITDEDKKHFDDDVMSKWREQHRKGRHRLPYEDDNAAARRVLDGIRAVRLCLGDEELDGYFSNGCYYLYSNIPRIGWLQNWDKKYKM